MVKLGIVKSYFMNFAEIGIFRKELVVIKVKENRDTWSSKEFFYLTIEGYFVKFKDCIKELNDFLLSLGSVI